MDTTDIPFAQAEEGFAEHGDERLKKQGDRERRESEGIPAGGSV